MSFTLARFTLHVAAATSIAVGALVGPPHISVRAVTPGTDAPSGAVLLIETRHHSDPADLSVSGRAEGLVNGKRISTSLQFTRQSAGHYTLARQWQAGAPWLLVLAAEQGPNGKHGVAEAIVRIDASGTVSGIDYPAPGWIDRSDVPKRTSAADIDAMVSRLVARR